MSTPSIPPPPGPDVPTQPHPRPQADDPFKGPFAPPEIVQPQPGTAPENPALPHPAGPPAPSPGPHNTADLGRRSREAVAYSGTDSESPIPRVAVVV